MPKITIDNTKGLVQASGAGLNLFGQAAQSLTAAAAGANALILATSTVVLMDSTNNAHQVSLPAIASVDLGHTIAIANIDTAQDVVLITPGGETINGAATVTLGEGTGNLCIKAAADKWILV